MALNLGSVAIPPGEAVGSSWGLVHRALIVLKAARKMLYYISSHHTLRAQPQERAAEKVQSTGREMHRDVGTTPNTHLTPNLHRKAHFLSFFFSGTNYPKLNSWLAICGKGCYDGA